MSSNPPRVPLPRRGSDSVPPHASLEARAQQHGWTKPKIESEAQSTAAKIFGLVVAICASVVVIMLTIWLGLVLFG